MPRGLWCGPASHTHTQPNLPWQKSTRAASVFSRTLGSYIQTRSLLRVRLVSVHVVTPCSSSTCNCNTYGNHFSQNKCIFLHTLRDFIYFKWQSQRFLVNLVIPVVTGSNIKCNLMLYLLTEKLLSL